MKTVLLTMVLLFLAFPGHAVPQGTSFTYQGELTDNNIPANGTYDFRVTLYDASVSGTSTGQQAFEDVTVTNGIFTLILDMGDLPFTGDENWLALEVRAGASTGAYDTLSPRNLITNSPYAIQAQFVGANGVDTLAIQDGQVMANDIGNNQITTDKLADNSVTASKITNSAVTVNKIASNAVGSDAIIDGSINQVDIQTGAITNPLLASNSVSTDKILDGAVTRSKLDSDVIGTLEIADGEITGADIQAGAINNVHLSVDSVTSDKISNGSVTSGKIDVDAVGSTEIADGSISGIDMQNDTITTSQLANDAVTLFDMADNSVGSNEIIDGSISLSDINTDFVQARVSASCSAGSSIRQIFIDGSVQCEIDDNAPAGWSLSGNTGTIPGTNFMGTSDNKAFEIRVDNRSAARIVPTSYDEAANYIGGHFRNTIDSGVHGAVIAGGGNWSFFNRISEHNAFIGGGRSNVIGDGDTNFDEGYASVITGGSSNSITGQQSSISGGVDNSISGDNSAIAGGQSNTVAGNYGFAAGFGSKANHNGSWVWNDLSDFDPANSLATTANNQFLVRAAGGVGIGTNTPSSPVHVVGQGTSTGSTPGSNEVVMTIQAPNNTNNVAVALNSMDNFKDAAVIFAKSGVPEYDIRNHQNRGLEFSHYDSTNNLNKTTLMRLISTSVQNRADFNVDVEPDINGMYKLGSPSFRWNTIYSLNPVDVSSDVRLKKNIKQLNYGLAEVMSMNPVSYDWTNPASSGNHLGLIAQEVEHIIPEVVSKADDKDQTRSMRYTELIPVLIKATQEQQQLIDQQATEIEALKDMVNKLLNQQ